MYSEGLHHNFPKPPDGSYGHNGFGRNSNGDPCAVRERALQNPAPKEPRVARCKFWGSPLGIPIRKQIMFHSQVINFSEICFKRAFN